VKLYLAFLGTEFRTLASEPGTRGEEPLALLASVGAVPAIGVSVLEPNRVEKVARTNRKLATAETGVEYEYCPNKSAPHAGGFIHDPVNDVTLAIRQSVTAERAVSPNEFDCLFSLLNPSE
jgi:hypothetical protein